MAYTPADRAGLQAIARAAVDAAGSQKALADTLGVSPRMIRHALGGTKGFNLRDALGAYTRLAGRGQTEQARATARTVYDQSRRPAGARGRRQAVRRIGSTRSLTSTAKRRGDSPALNVLQTRELDAAASTGKRASVRIEYTDSSGHKRTGFAFAKGGVDARVLQALIRQAGSLADAIKTSGAGSGMPAAGATITSIELTVF